ncbi:MAG TPA: hypothetical protein VFO65_00915, partial [Acidimicrobiales bacterium]|nr:hypothetical protein [Acidimicrobiales bacterium]
GTVAGVVGDVARAVTYSRIGPKHRLAAWARLLALTAAHPDRPFEAVTVGRSRRSGKVAVAAVGPLAGDPDTRRQRALAHLGVILDLHQRGLCQPLPLYCATSAAWAEAMAARGRPEREARKAWVTTWEWTNEDRDLEHRLVLGGVRSFDDLVAEEPVPGEDGPGWAEDEPSRLGRYARRLWDGLLACERLSDS